VLLRRSRSDAVTTAIIGLLHRSGALQTALDVNDESYYRADEIAGGMWPDGSSTAEVNLALTAAMVLPTLG